MMSCKQEHFLSHCIELRTFELENRPLYHWAITSLPGTNIFLLKLFRKTCLVGKKSCFGFRNFKLVTWSCFVLPQFPGVWNLWWRLLGWYAEILFKIAIGFLPLKKIRARLNFNFYLVTLFAHPEHI